MDDVPIVIPNQVKPIFHQPQINNKPSPKPKPVGTFLNFFYMMPFAIIILFQAFYLGKIIGDYTTFPLFTIQSYYSLGTIAVLMVLMQFFLRSMVYSSLFGGAIVAGIFYSWFGNFWTPVIQNSKEFITIIKSALTNKEIPYPILMTGVIPLVIGVVTGFNFILSLFVKFAFEFCFGREWSDGRKNAYIFSIIFMICVLVGFSIYSKKYSNSNIILWKYLDKYFPLEEFIIRTPSGVQITSDRICLYTKNLGVSLNQTDGKELKKTKDISGGILTPTWWKHVFPIIPDRKGLIAYDVDFMAPVWQCDFPIQIDTASITEKLSTDSGSSGKDSKLPDDFGIPLVLRQDISDQYIVAFFDFGYRGVISKKDGKVLWVRLIDSPIKANRLFLEDFITSAWVIEKNNVMVFSCSNGKLAAVNSITGNHLWEFTFKDSKLSWKAQRAYLSVAENYIIAAYPSGSIITLDLTKGIKVYEAHAGVTKWAPVTPVYKIEDEGAFVSADGKFYRVRLDGGAVMMNAPLFDTPPTILQTIFENKPNLFPMPINIPEGFAGFRDQVFFISSATRKIEPIFSFPKHVFVTQPLVDGDFMYIGTQDGWVFCFHRESFHQKWKVHINGELENDSLYSIPTGILVRTKSGSLYCLKKGA